MNWPWLQLLLALAVGAGWWESCEAKPPNIIFILSDDLGYGDVSDSPMVNRTHEIPTPNIQRLADEGMRFLRGYSGQVCAPSRCTLMTGRHLGHCRVRGNGGAYTPLLESDVTVATVLQDKYATGIVGKWGLGDFNSTGYPLDQGFQHYVGQANQIDCHNWYPEVIQNNTVGDCIVKANINATNASCGAHHSKCTWVNDLVNAEAIKFIREHGQPSAEKPFFLFFSTTTPHTGFLAGDHAHWAVPAPYDTRFDFGPNQNDFAAATSAQDDFVGAVLEELKSLNIDNNTIVFFAGDNGPDDHPFAFFDDPGRFRGKKRSLHEGGIRQTIVARWPGHVAANSTADHMFAFWDFLPTAAELGGLDVPPGVDGVSAAAVLQGDASKQQQHKYLYWEFCHGAAVNGLLPQQYRPGWIQAVRYDAEGAGGPRTEWKAIRSDRGEVLLYNLTADVSESVNVSAQFPDVVARIVAMMDEAHVEDPYWKSSQNRSDKCCGTCGREAGCRYPCVMRNTSAHSSDISPPIFHISSYYLIGAWQVVTGFDDRSLVSPISELRIGFDAVAVEMYVDAGSGDACLHGRSVSLHADLARREQVVTLHSGRSTGRRRACKTTPPSAPLRGTLHTDGNSLYIVWADTEEQNVTNTLLARSSTIWRKPEFDFD